MALFLTFSDQIELIHDLAYSLDEHLLDLEKRFGKKHYKAEFIGRPLTTLTENILSLKGAADTFGDAGWWGKFDFSPAEKDYLLASQYIHIKFTFFVKFFSSIESQFRILYRNLYPANPEMSTKSFYQLYKQILTHFGLLDSSLGLYDLSRLIRNLIHNSGIHTSMSQVVNYRGENYQFTQWDEPLVLTPQLQFTIYRDLSKSIIAIKDNKLFNDLSNY